jgi:hypothetical protein
MKVNIPLFIEGILRGQYTGDLEQRIISKNKLSLPTKAKKYSIVLYKDFHIDNTIIVSEEVFNEAKSDEQWWKINHTANAAIEFLEPFFEQYSFLRHKPIEIYVEKPDIISIDKRNDGKKTFGILNGRVRAKLVEPPKEIIKPEIIDTKVVENSPKQNVEPHQVLPQIPVNNGCFNKNENWNRFLGLSDGPSGPGGLYGLTGGPLGSKGCFGKYGNPNGCFGGSTMGGCFPNLNLGCLLPLLLLLLLLFTLFKSCDSIRTLDPIVNTIKKDRDDSRTPPPNWVRNPEDTLAPEPDYTPLLTDSTSIADTMPIVLDSIPLIPDSVLLIADSTSVNLKKGQFQLEIWDWDVEDKDTVSLYLNNKLLVQNLRLRKKPYQIKDKGLVYGENYLEIRAMNIQKGSNTAAVKGFSDRSKLCDTTLIQKSTQTTRLTLIYQ